MANIATGLDQFVQKYWKRFRGQSLGLLANQASVDHNLQNAKDVISSLLPGQLKITFGPQHGFTGEDQDNMVETEDYVDPALHIPTISLYGKKTDRLSHFLDTIDLLVIDLQDVGTRVYTFIATMLFCLKEAAKAGKRVLLLDRPNPLGGVIVEGNLLRPEFYSLVGPFALPIGTCYGRILDYDGLCLLPICPFQKPLRYIRDRLSGKAQMSQKGGAHAAHSRYLVHPLSIPSLSRNSWHLKTWKDAIYRSIIFGLRSTNGRTNGVTCLTHNH
jgi:hypothetical protein